MEELQIEDLGYYEPQLYYADSYFLCVTVLVLQTATEDFEHIRKGEAIYVSQKDKLSASKDVNFISQPPFFETYEAAKAQVLKILMPLYAKLNNVDGSVDPNPNTITLWRAYESYSFPDVVRVVLTKDDKYDREEWNMRIFGERLTYPFDTSDPQTCSLPSSYYRTKDEAVAFMKKFFDRKLKKLNSNGENK